MNESEFLAALDREIPHAVVALRKDHPRLTWSPEAVRTFALLAFQCPGPAHEGEVFCWLRSLPYPVLRPQALAWLTPEVLRDASNRLAGRCKRLKLGVAEVVNAAWMRTQAVLTLDHAGVVQIPREEKAVLPWFLVLARNVAIDMVRQRKSSPELPPDVASNAGTVLDDVIEAEEDRRDLAELHSELHREAFNTLPQQQQDAIRLILSGKGAPTAARELGLTTEAFHKVLQASREAYSRHVLNGLRCLAREGRTGDQSSDTELLRDALENLPDPHRSVLRQVLLGRKPAEIARPDFPIRHVYERIKEGKRLLATALFHLLWREVADV